GTARVGDIAFRPVIGEAVQVEAEIVEAHRLQRDAEWPDGHDPAAIQGLRIPIDLEPRIAIRHRIGYCIDQGIAELVCEEEDHVVGNSCGPLEPVAAVYLCDRKL